MPSVRIYQKKQLRIDHLNIKQMQMFKLATVSVAAVKNRLAAAQGPDDTPAKPLSKYYAIRKTKMGRGNRRNLMLTGDMLRNFNVRTVSEKRAVASNTTRKDRVKAWITSQIEPWAIFSPKNRETVQRAGKQMIDEISSRLVLERSLGGKQL
jgi:hypothetical protein